MLYAGQNNESSFESALHPTAPWYTEHIFAVESLRGLDMLSDEPYNTLCAACVRGEVAANIGPNCRTWFIRLHIKKEGGGAPKRARLYPARWGLDNLAPQAQSKVDGDNLLLGRQMVLMHLARAPTTWLPRASLSGWFLRFFNGSARVT